MTGPRRSPLAMAVLLLLDESPMHPYGLRRRIQEWGKDMVINVSQRNAIYQIVERLERAGLVAVKETARVESRPERTIYATTDIGSATARRWLLDMIATPESEFPQFPGALAFLNSVSPDETRIALEHRASTLETTIAQREHATVAAAADGVGRLHLIEVEYLQAVARAELTWISAVLADLDSGTLTWQAPPASEAG